MKLVYSMIVHDDADGLWGEFPDLPGCFTMGDDLADLLKNAAEAIACDLENHVEDSVTIPRPTDPKTISLTDPNTFLTLVEADLDPGRYGKSVKKTLSVPAWLNERAREAHLNFSHVLQEALMEKLKII